MVEFDRDSWMKLTKAEILDQYEIDATELEDLRDAQGKAPDEFDRDALMNRTKAQILDAVEAQMIDTATETNSRLRTVTDSVFRMMSTSPDTIAAAQAEMAVLHDRIADLEKRLASALEENRALKGQTTSAININFARED